MNGLGISVVAALLYELVMERGLPSTFNTYGMLALVLIYWAVIRISGPALSRSAARQPRTAVRQLLPDQSR